MKREKVRWITIVGQSPFAAINGLWDQVKKGINPKEIYVLRTEDEITIKNCEDFKKYVKVIISEYISRDKPNIKEVPFDENDVEGFDRLLYKLIEKSPLPVILDMTPGRKYMSALVMGKASMDKVIKLIYVHLFDNTYKDQPYPLIPKDKQRVYDFKKFVNRRKS